MYYYGYMPAFRDWLRETLEERGLKQQALAALVGVSQAAVSGWLNSGEGKDRPRAESLLKIAAVTGADPYFLFNMVYGLPMPSGDVTDEEAERILRKIEILPEGEREQAEGFIDYLLTRVRRNKNASIGSASNQA